MTDLLEEIETNGYIILKNVLTEDFIQRAVKELENAIDKEAAYHGSKEYSDYGMVLNCAIYEGVFWELFNNQKLIGAVNSVLGEGCIVYAYTSSSMPPKKSNYSNRIHVDCPRFIDNYITNLGATIALDSFTKENGATYFLPQSHKHLEQPEESLFFAKAKRFIADPGDVLLFNARLWHLGGENHTSKWRHALTLNMCRPWMKQRIDIPRSLRSHDLTKMSSATKQKLGFYAQIPATYDEYYAPPEKRMYRQKTE